MAAGLRRRYPAATAILAAARENKSVPWNPHDFDPLVYSLLEASAGRAIPLSASEFVPLELPPNLLSTPPAQLFPKARDASAALSGLLLMMGHWDLSHQISQDVSSREGSYWHALAHRIEPDSANAAYWFRQVGEHPVFSALHEQAKRLPDWRAHRHWDPQAFLVFCDETRTAAGSAKYECALKIQRAECDLLFSWCALTQE
jgi:hypothetical protein